MKYPIFFSTKGPHTLAVVHFTDILAELTTASIQTAHRTCVALLFSHLFPSPQLIHNHLTLLADFPNRCPTIHRPSQIVSTAFRDLGSTLVGQRSVLVQHFPGHNVTLYSQLQISFFLKKIILLIRQVQGDFK